VIDSPVPQFPARYLLSIKKLAQSPHVGLMIADVERRVQQTRAGAVTDTVWRGLLAQPPPGAIMMAHAIFDADRLLGFARTFERW
jgi:hypothetical protein